MVGTDRYDGSEEYGAVAREDMTVRTPGTVPTGARRGRGDSAGGEEELSARRIFDESSGDGLATPEVKAVAPARRRAARFLKTQGRRAVAFLDLAEMVAAVMAFSPEEMATEKAARRQASLQLQVGSDICSRRALI